MIKIGGLSKLLILFLRHFMFVFQSMFHNNSWLKHSENLEQGWMKVSESHVKRRKYPRRPVVNVYKSGGLSDKKYRFGTTSSNARVVYKFECRFCGKLFSGNSGLYFHLPEHTGEWRYNCDTCMKGFMKKDRYIAHITRPCKGPD